MSGHTKECVLWGGAIDSDGYGRIQKDGKWQLAHRVVWMNAVGPITGELVIDHLCRNRKCVNVSHMEIVTNAENVLRGVGITALNKRKTHCLRGHEFTSENTIKTPNGRSCRACSYDRWKAYKARKIEAGTWAR